MSCGVGTGVPATALMVLRLWEPPPSQEGGEREQPERTQPAVDRSPFRKRGLSPAPLQQAVKSLASQEIKRRPGGRANRVGRAACSGDGQKGKG